MSRFLDSLIDPRALGRGDCSFAAMLTHGMTTVCGTSLYACPSLSCEEDAAETIDREELAAMREELTRLWPQFKGEELLPDEAASAFCRNMGDLNNQGNLPVDEECIEALFTGETNPWDTSAACIVEGTSTEPRLFASFSGVPMGIGCKFYEGGGELPKGEKRDPGGMDLPDDLPDFIDGLKDTVNKIAEFFSSGPSARQDGASLNLNDPISSGEEADAKRGRRPME